MSSVSTSRSLIVAVFAAYLVLLLAVTLLPDAGSFRGDDVRVHLTPLRTIGVAFRQGFGSHEWAILLGNLAAFVPLGFLLPLVLRRRSWLLALLVAFGLSLAIETAQLAISLAVGFGYRTADVDDVILNVAGAGLGYAGLLISDRLTPGARRV